MEENRRFLNDSPKCYALAKLFVGKSCNATLNMLDLIRFRPQFEFLSCKRTLLQGTGFKPNGWTALHGKTSNSKNMFSCKRQIQINVLKTMSHCSKILLYKA